MSDVDEVLKAILKGIEEAGVEMVAYFRFKDGREGHMFRTRSDVDAQQMCSTLNLIAETKVRSTLVANLMEDAKKARAEQKEEG